MTAYLAEPDLLGVPLSKPLDSYEIEMKEWLLCRELRGKCLGRRIVAI